MNLAEQMKVKTEAGAYDKIIAQIEYLAEKGISQLITFDYDIILSESITNRLRLEGFTVSGGIISW